MQGTIGKKIMFFQKTVEVILANICWGIMLTCRAQMFIIHTDIANITIFTYCLSQSIKLSYFSFS